MMLLLYGIVFYLFVGSNNLASGCLPKRKNDDDGRIKTFSDAMWRFESEFLQHVGKPDKTKFAYSPHSAAISLLAVAFGGEIKCRMAEPMHLNMSDLKVPLSSSGKFGSGLREFVRLGRIGARGVQIVTTKYANQAAKQCKVKPHFNDVLEQLRIDKFLPKGGLSSKHTVKSVVTDTISVNIADFAEKCSIKKSSSKIEFHAENVREGKLESLNGVKFYAIKSTNPDIPKADKVKLVFIVPQKKLKLKDLKKLFSQLKYSELSHGSKKPRTFSMRKPAKITKQYDLKSLFSHMGVNMSRKHSDTIADKFDDICSLKDDFSMHGYHLKQSATFEFNMKDMKTAPRCSKAKRRINVKLPTSIVVLVVAKNTILAAAAT